MIKINNLSFKYDNNIVLDNINLEISNNKITYIIGKNGSGKSTLAQIISGLIFTNKGTIKIDELDINKKTSNILIRKKIGIVFQKPSNQIIFTNVYDDIKFTLENLHTHKKNIDSIIKSSLNKVHMLKHLNSNPYNLSGGEQQRIAIASQISLSPKYLIFDESTSMLDQSNKKDIYNLLKELKKDMGIIFITNNIEEIKYADDLVIIDNKSVYKYHISEILQNPSILANHHLEIPFIFKIAKSLNINNIKNLNEKYILERLNNI